MPLDQSSTTVLYVLSRQLEGSLYLSWSSGYAAISLSPHSVLMLSVAELATGTVYASEVRCSVE